MLKIIARIIKKYIELFFLQEDVNFSSAKKVFIFLGADYGNLGDVAITKYQKFFLEDIMPERETIVIPMSKTYRWYKSIRKQIKNDDIITLIGGGNFGDLYPGYQLKRIFVIKKFRNRIISFPQTYYYADEATGKILKKSTIKAIKKHANISVFARDKKSYIRMKNDLGECASLAPDIVMYANIKPKRSGSGILLCFRNDKENSLNLKDRKKIIEYFNEAGEEIKLTDTIAKNTNGLQSELNEKLEEFASAKLVITNRLHGMIFSYITNTPCLAINNNNGKVIDTYDSWLKECSYIVTAKEKDKDIKKKIEQLMKCDDKPTVNIPFDLLAKECRR